MSRLADEVRKTFASMHVSRNFRLFFVGQLISVSGTWVNATALAVLVLRLTDSGVALGIMSALLFLPVLLFGVLGGSLADRFDKRRILVWANAGYGALAAIQFALVATGVVEIWMVYVIAFLSGLILAIEPPTRQSFYVELVGDEHITNAISLNSAVFTGTRVLGGAIAGHHDRSFGLSSPFLLDAVSYIAVILALLAMRTGELHPQRKAVREPGLVRAGLRYVWASRELRVPLIVMSLVYLFSFNFSILIPLHAERTYGGSAQAIGFLYAAIGLGAFLGAIVMANRQPESVATEVGRVLGGVRCLPRRRRARADVPARLDLDGAGGLRVDALRDHGELHVAAVHPRGHAGTRDGPVHDDLPREHGDRRADHRVGRRDLGRPGHLRRQWSDRRRGRVDSAAGACVGCERRVCLREILLLDPSDPAALDGEPPRDVRAGIVGGVRRRDRLDPRIDVPRLELAAGALGDVLHLNVVGERQGPQTRVVVHDVVPVHDLVAVIRRRSFRLGAP